MGLFCNNLGRKKFKIWHSSLTVHCHVFIQDFISYLNKCKRYFNSFNCYELLRYEADVSDMYCIIYVEQGYSSGSGSGFCWVKMIRSRRFRDPVPQHWLYLCIRGVPFSISLLGATPPLLNLFLCTFSAAIIILPVFKNPFFLSCFHCLNYFSLRSVRNSLECECRVLCSL